jgi:hypothetical protein
MTWTWDAVWKVLQPQPKRSGMVCTLTSSKISANFPKSGEASVVVRVSGWSHMPIHNLRSCSNASYMSDLDLGCSLKGSTASTKAWLHGLHTCIRWDFSQLSQNKGSICGGIGVNVKPYAHSQPEKVLKHLIYVWNGHGMTFERFYSLNQSVVAWFAHLHLVGFQPTFTNLGKHLWW